MSDKGMGAYTEAVKSGLYDKKSGLVGKYDNVRKYWEDEITRMFIQPHLNTLIEHTRQQSRRLRILDIGCGSADGFELLSGIRCHKANLQDVETELITPGILGKYRGVDLNEDLLNQARAIYGNNPKMEFAKGDFTEGVPVEKHDDTYDFYFTSFGTCSHHNSDDTMIELLADIARRTQSYALVVCDWIGRYSYEWQELWTHDHANMLNMDYVVSYIYEPEEREEKRDQLQHITLRLMSREEADHIIREASRLSGVNITPLTFFDRSIFTGRHMDTCEYNLHSQPIREAVNSLHESNVRTDLSSLIIDYAPKPHFDAINNWFESTQMCWNGLISYTQQLLDAYCDEENEYKDKHMPDPVATPAILAKMMARMRRLVEGTGWIDTGLPRENIIEPQLGYALRQLMMGLQEGRGYAHGVVSVLAIDKCGVTTPTTHPATPPEI